MDKILEIKGKRFVISKNHAKDGDVIMLHQDLSLHIVQKSFEITLRTTELREFFHIDCILLTPIINDMQYETAKRKICFECHDEEKEIVNQGMCYDCYVAWYS